MIRNYLGFPRGISGMRLAQRARNQAIRFGTRFFTGWDVAALEPGADGDPHVLRTDGGDVHARAVVIATGVAYRKLGVESARRPGRLRRPLRRRDDRGPRDGGRRRRRRRRRQLRRPGRGPPGPLRPLGHDHGPAARPRRDDVAVPDRRDRLQPADRGPQPRRASSTAAATAGWSGSTSRTSPPATVTAASVRGLFLLLGAEPHCDWLPDEVARDERGFVLTGRDVPKRALGRRAAAGEPRHDGARHLRGRRHPVRLDEAGRRRQRRGRVRRPARARLAGLTARIQRLTCEFNTTVDNDLGSRSTFVQPNS